MKSNPAGDTRQKFQSQERVSPDPNLDFSAFAQAISAIDAFIRTVRCQASSSSFLNSIDKFLAMQNAIDAANRSVTSRQFPPDPLRTNYIARLQTLDFELRRLTPLLRQEHARLTLSLHNSTAQHAWLETLSRTQ